MKTVPFARGQLKSLPSTLVPSFFTTKIIFPGPLSFNWFWNWPLISSDLKLSAWNNTLSFQSPFYLNGVVWTNFVKQNWTFSRSSVSVGFHRSRKRHFLGRNLYRTSRLQFWGQKIFRIFDPEIKVKRGSEVIECLFRLGTSIQSLSPIIFSTGKKYI